MIKAEDKLIISGTLGVPELLAQMAEECSELAQAALKLRRVLDKTNPTPRTYEDAIDNLREEYTDVYVVGELLNLLPDIGQIAWKTERWKERLMVRKPDETD